MKDIHQEEKQPEFFNEFSRAEKKPERFPSLNKAQKPILVSTNAEQLIFSGIIAILVLCGVFFLGVLRGKSLRAPVFSAAPVSAAARAPRTTAHAAMPRVQPARPIAAGEGRTGGPPASALKETAPVPAKGREVSPAVKPYTIQLVTYKKKDLAEAEVAGLRRKGFYSAIIPSGDYFQVSVGLYATKEDAKKYLRYFGSRYKGCFLRRR